MLKELQKRDKSYKKGSEGRIMIEIKRDYEQHFNRKLIYIDLWEVVCINSNNIVRYLPSFQNWSDGLLHRS